MKDHLPLKNGNFYLIKNLKCILEKLKNTEKGQWKAHKFINKTSRNYSPLSLHKALVRKENIFLGPSLNFPFFLIHLPSTIFYTTSSLLLKHKEQAGEWLGKKQRTPLWENISGNAYCVSISIFQRKEHLPIFWDHRHNYFYSKLPATCPRVQSLCA